MSNPATPSQKFTLYKDNTGAFSFTLLSGETPIDIVNEYLTLRVVFYARTGGIETGEFLFDYDLADLTLTNTNTVSSTITKERVNQLFGKGLNFVQLVVTTATRTETLYVNQVQVFNDTNGAELSNASTLDVDGDFNVTVSVSLLETPVQLDGVILIDGQFTTNRDFRFNDLSLAITKARALIADGYKKVVLRATLDASNQPIGLGANSYYDLYDEGIIFQSDFDVWKQYVTNGGTLAQSDMLYDVPQNKLSINING